MPTTSTRAETSGTLVDATAPVQIVPANSSRDAVVIHNAVGLLFVKCGQNASSTDYTYRLTSNATLEISGYIGPITAIASEATFVRITELV